MMQCTLALLAPSGVGGLGKWVRKAPGGKAPREAMWKKSKETKAHVLLLKEVPRESRAGQVGAH